MATAKEVAILRQDLDTARDMLMLSKREADRLKSLISDLKQSHTETIESLTQGKVAAEQSATTLQLELNQAKSEVRRLSRELEEALLERRKQYQSMVEVRTQVDSRLTRLMEELHRKEEELHQLQYVARQRERDHDRVEMLERMVSSREENVSTLSLEVEKLRHENAALQTEVDIMKDRVERANAIAAAAATASASASPPRPPSEPVVHQQPPTLVAAAPIDIGATVLPLYRQWSADVEKDLYSLEETVDALFDELTDTKCVIEFGPASASLVAGALVDRRRIAMMRKQEHDRALQQQQSLAMSAASNDDMLGLNVQAIRISSDNVKHVLNKLKAAIHEAHGLSKNVRGIAERSVSQRAPLRVAGEVGVPPQPLPMPDTELIYEQLREKERKVFELENVIRQKDREIADAESDRARLRDEVARTEKDKLMAVQALKDQLQEAHKQADELRRSFDEATSGHHNSVRQRETEHQKEITELYEKMRTQESAHAAMLRELQNRSVAEIAEKSEEISQLNLKVNAAVSNEAHLRAAVEESKEKRLAMRRQRDELLQTVAELKNVIGQHNNEMRVAKEQLASQQDMIDQLQHVIEFEAAQREESQLLSIDRNDDVFQEWKRQNRAGGGHRPPARPQQRPPAVVIKRV